MKKITLLIDEKTNSLKIGDSDYNSIKFDGKRVEELKFYYGDSVAYITHDSVIGKHNDCGGPVVSDWDYYNDCSGAKCLACGGLLNDNEWLSSDKQLINEYKSFISDMENDYYNEPDYFNMTTLLEYCNDQYQSDYRDEVDELGSPYYTDNEGFYSNNAKYLYKLLKTNGFVDEPWTNF